MSGGNGKWVFGGREGEGGTDEAEDDCYDCCGGGVAAGFGHDGWVSFSLIFFGLDWIESDWTVGGGRSGSDWRFTTAICSSSS